MSLRSPVPLLVIASFVVLCLSFVCAASPMANEAKQHQSKLTISYDQLVGRQTSSGESDSEDDDDDDDDDDWEVEYELHFSAPVNSSDILEFIQCVSSVIEPTTNATIEVEIESEDDDDDDDDNDDFPECVQPDCYSVELEIEDLDQASAEAVASLLSSTTSISNCTIANNTLLAAYSQARQSAGADTLSSWLTALF